MKGRVMEKRKKTKAQKRELMKAAALLSASIDVANEIVSGNRFQLNPKIALLQARLTEIRRTPAKLFRHDRPELDRRKLKRSMKCARLIRKTTVATGIELSIGK